MEREQLLVRVNVVERPGPINVPGQGWLADRVQTDPAARLILGRSNGRVPPPAVLRRLPEKSNMEPMTSIRVVAALLLGLALSGPAFAQNPPGLPVAGARAGASFGHGVAAFSPRDFSTALHVWQALAEQGNPKAQIGVGVIYYTGRGVPADYGEAVKWFKLAAHQGEADALYNLGVMYAFGVGVETDRAASKHYYRLAANQGHEEALKALR